MKIKELELAASTARAGPIPHRDDFDVSEHVRFVPPFQETEVDKYFYTLRRWQQACLGPKKYGHSCSKVFCSVRHVKLIQPCQWIKVQRVTLLRVLSSEPMN